MSKAAPAQKQAHKAARSKAKGLCSSTSSEASKRLLSNAHIGQLLDDDLRRESKRAKSCHPSSHIVLAEQVMKDGKLKPNLIPAKLKERFPDAVGV